MLVPMRQLLDDAAAGGYGLGAFGISNLEQAHAIMGAAVAERAPLIMMISSKNAEYAGMRHLAAIAHSMAEAHPDIPMALHLDHGLSPAQCDEAIALGFTSVMIDGSLEEDGRTPRSYEDNVAVTREVVERARPLGITVEGELGTLGRAGEATFTEPEQAVDFVERTGVDALAVAIGTSHGAYKFDRAPDADVLAMHVVEEIAERLPGTHLVLHGASSVPREVIERINSNGGAVPPSFGVPVEEIRRGIQHGVRKVNVDTDGRLAMTAAVREHLAQQPESYDPRQWLAAATAAMRDVVAERMRQFGQAGRAG